jgi:uncharacterized protein YjbI with pentapeptide repeats
MTRGIKAITPEFLATKTTVGDTIEIQNDVGEIIYRYGIPKGKWDLDSADLRGANLERADLFGKVMYDANLEGANLKRAILYGAGLFGANLKNSNLEEACLRGADLKEVNFEGANLRNADFSADNTGHSTSLQAANLSTANLEGACFVGASYDERTVFPSDFDPERAGMKKTTS